MAYDEELAERVRELLADRGDVTEQAMFGGLAYLVGGRMGVTASGQGGLMVKVGSRAAAGLIDTTAAEPVRMGERVMRAWVRVATTALAGDEDLGRWVERGVEATGD